jgi:hypothetical protein
MFDEGDRSAPDQDSRYRPDGLADLRPDTLPRGLPVGPGRGNKLEPLAALPEALVLQSPVNRIDDTPV